MEKTQQEKSLQISMKSFAVALGIIFLLMLLTYVLTFFIPGGEYTRVMDENGNAVISADSVFTYTEGGISFFKWLFSPVLLLGASGGGTVIAIIAFLLVIGGSFTGLDRCGLMRYMLIKLVCRFSGSKYRLLAALTLFFMSMGALIGSFEECVPLVPIITALAVSLGWDALTGMGMSLLAVGCGFAAGLCNPFTVGVAQSLSGLPMFSGIWLRAVSFVLIYLLLLAFLVRHAKRIDKNEAGESAAEATFQKDPKMERALAFFACVMGAGLLCVLCSGFVTALQDYTMIIVAVVFLVAGLGACLLSGMGKKALGKAFLGGMISILPAVLLILMASSVNYTLTEAHIVDTLLYWAIGAVENLPRWAIVLFIYFLVLVMNFFISSGSAKALMMIPLIVPMASVFSVHPQLCVMAFAFGDGFSNVFYPTNAALLISLGLAGVSYGQWVRYSWKFQVANILLTSGLLLFGLAVGYC